MVGLLIPDQNRLPSVNLGKLSASLVAGRAVGAVEEVKIGLAGIRAAGYKGVERTGMVPVQRSNGKSYEPEPVKGSGMKNMGWRPTLLFGLVAWTAA